MVVQQVWLADEDQDSSGNRFRTSRNSLSLQIGLTQDDDEFVPSPTRDRLVPADRRSKAASHLLQE